MEHRKMPQRQQLNTPHGVIDLEGPVPPTDLARMRMHAGLSAFRRPAEQHEALVEIAGLPEGRIVLARLGEEIIGYVTFHYPDPYERWSEGQLPDLIELGAIEVAAPYRGLGIARKLIELAFAQKQLDNVIVYTTEYYWHWDLKGTGLDVYQYRKVMEDLMKCVGMVWCATDDPEICAHPANCLMVRVGPEVPQASVEKFDRVRFQNRFLF
jgi:acetoin utilization protein AcuA